MADKLTLSDCMKYPNAQIIPAEKGKWSGWIKSIDLEHKMLVVSLKGFYPEVHMDVHIAGCKLILREITELTDKEIKKCHDIALWDGDGVPIDERRILIDEKLKFWDCSLSKAERDLADYLKEINVDIYGFLKCGKAVKND